jgi:hypothetical protein
VERRVRQCSGMSPDDLAIDLDRIKLEDETRDVGSP